MEAVRLELGVDDPLVDTVGKLLETRARCDGRVQKVYKLYRSHIVAIAKRMSNATANP
jgi:hypothetical protein